MDLINILNIILVVLVFIIVSLVLIYFAVVYRNKNNKNAEIKGSSKSSSDYTSAVATGLPREAIEKFMDFDEIKDNMIIRKNRTQYVMILQCQGVNYDLMSEDEKMAVEQGFVQFLNTLRFPIQLYVQTRSLNLKDIIDGYKDRVKNMKTEVENIRSKMNTAKLQGNTALYEKLKYEERRKENVLEYGADIADYIGRMSLNKNVLQQKTYVIVSYYASENGSISNYSKEEIDDLCFQELFTRSQSVMRSLAASEVTGKILTSEELAELLYIAYNRDDSELLQLSKAASPIHVKLGKFIVVSELHSANVIWPTFSTLGKFSVVIEVTTHPPGPISLTLLGKLVTPVAKYNATPLIISMPSGIIMLDGIVST